VVLSGLGAALFADIQPDKIDRIEEWPLAMFGQIQVLQPVSFLLALVMTGIGLAAADIVCVMHQYTVIGDVAWLPVSLGNENSPITV
jgi:hypothetical protein